MLSRPRVGVYAFILFVAAALTPAFYVCVSDDSQRAHGIAGLVPLLLGWLGPTEGVFSWYANPFLIAAIIFLRRNRTPPLWMSAPGLLLVLTAFVPFSFPINEAGPAWPVCGLGIGYFLWLGTAFLVFAASIAPSAVRTD